MASIRSGIGENMEEKDKIFKQLADDYNEAIAEVRFNMSTIGLKESSIKRIVKARDLAIKALEKQIPKKPDFTEDKEFALCPCCNGNGLADKQKYCDNCGQKLDWSDTE
mgnify:CR=1 FL=1